MAISNRDLDASEQRKIVHQVIGAIATGVTRYVMQVAQPCVLEQVRAAATGVSNAMTLQVSVDRFVPGAGLTNIAGMATALVLVNLATSGPQAAVLAASGSTLLALQSGDIVKVVSAVASGNATDLAVSLVLKSSQDIRSFYGV